MIEVKNLNKIYSSFSGDVKVLSDINFKINDAELTIIEGVSGSGKSTLLSIMAGLEKPTSGEVVIDNDSIAKLPDIHISRLRASTIGMVFQNFNLIENLSSLDNVLTPLIALKTPLKEAKYLAENALKVANIEHQKNQVVSKLSGGEKQRVAIARAIVANPTLLLCDEPTANLDYKNSKIFLELITKLSKKGITIVIATHDPIFKELELNYSLIMIKSGQILSKEQING